MSKAYIDDLYKRLDKHPNEVKLQLLEDHAKRTDLDKFSMALLYEHMGRTSIKLRKFSAEYFERAGNLFEDCWVLSHIHSTLKKSKQKKLLLRALKNYNLARSIYDSKGLNVSEKRILKRVKDIEFQLRGYGGVQKQLIILLTLFSFLSSITFFSYNFTGFSIASVDTEQSFMLGGILLFLAVMGIIYIIFFGYFAYFNGSILLEKDCTKTILSAEYFVIYERYSGEGGK